MCSETWCLFGLTHAVLIIPKLEGKLVFLLHQVLVWAQGRPDSQHEPKHSVADGTPEDSSLALAYTEMTCSTALLFPFELRRLGARFRVKLFSGLGKEPDFGCLDSGITGSTVSFQANHRPWPSMTPAQWGQRISGVRAESNDNKKCHLCLMCRLSMACSGLEFKVELGRMP